MSKGLLLQQYLMILLLLVPAALFAFLPLKDSLKKSPRSSFGIFLGIALILALLLSFVGAETEVSEKILLAIGLLPLFGLFIYLTKENLIKKLFVYLNSTMIIGYALLYGKLLSAPLELEDSAHMVQALSGSLCLVVALILAFLFWKTLTTKMPYLLSTDALDLNLRFVVLIPLFITLLLFWVTPHSAAVVMTGRVRITALAFLLLAPLSLLVIYQGFWRIAVNLTENARLKEENELMEMETKRYEELRSYMNETRSLRHDFRQHLLVMDEYAKSGETEKLTDYINQFSASLADHKGTFSANAAVDAVASHYDQVADNQNTKIKWLLEIPETLPIPESDYIAIFGNLVENALNAVHDLPEEKRNIQVTARMLSDAMMGLTVKNHYEGVIKMGKKGLPKSSRPGHGIGLYSVEAAVSRYNGALDINTDNGVFTAGVVLYPNSNSL